ncbi:MAG: hypothetical protein U0930_06345 [Pirellulales bacterium]
MSLYDFFFPEEAQASHLRRIADGQHRAQRIGELASRRSYESELRITDVEERVLKLERDLGFVALMLGSIVSELNTKGVVTRKELSDIIEKLDARDGFPDESLDIDRLRAWGSKDETI